MSNVAKRRCFFFHFAIPQKRLHVFKKFSKFEAHRWNIFFTNLPLALLNFKMHFLNFM